MLSFVYVVRVTLAFLASFTIAATPSSGLGSLIRSGAALTALNISGIPVASPTQLPAAEAAAVTVGRFPPKYFVPYTNPQIILVISPDGQIPITPYTITHGIIYGLNSLVEDAISAHGDRPIGASGMHFGATGVGIFVKGHLPGTEADITISQTSYILQGLWEVLAVYGAFTMEAHVYIGGLGPAQYRGIVTIFKNAAEWNATEDVVASAVTESVKMMA